MMLSEIKLVGFINEYLPAGSQANQNEFTNDVV